MRTLLLALVLLVPACVDSTGPSDPSTALALARAKWLATDFPSYTYTLERICECVPEMTGPVVIEVRDRQVDQRRYLSGAAVDPQFFDLFTTVPGLFDLIDDAINRPAAAIAVRYNPAYGYPESIQIDWVAGAVDDEVSYRVSDFALLEPR